MTRSRAYAIVLAACVLPRAIVMVHERAGLLADMEKSDVLACVLLKTGTFGYVPGEPSANTQPLYGWFLWLVYWLAGRHWWSIGVAQLLVAALTALLVYEIGRRELSNRAGLIAAVVATLQPYLVWHDMHGNREILDQLLGGSDRGLFRRSELERLLREHADRRADHGHRLWCLCMLELWQRTYVDAGRPALAAA